VSDADDRRIDAAEPAEGIIEIAPERAEGAPAHGTEEQALGAAPGAEVDDRPAAALACDAVGCRFAACATATAAGLRHGRRGESGGECLVSAHGRGLDIGNFGVALEIKDARPLRHFGGIDDTNDVRLRQLDIGAQPEIGIEPHAPIGRRAEITAKSQCLSLSCGEQIPDQRMRVRRRTYATLFDHVATLQKSLIGRDRNIVANLATSVAKTAPIA
jgi:hypothetical protein